MSYLNPLRLHFAGQFQASVSTVNNDPIHYDNANFQASYQEPQTSTDMNGWWNPRGDGAWRLIGCRVTAAVANGLPVASDDLITSCLIADSDQQTTAKLVDLDPQQQMVSEIWGLQVRITDGSGNTLLRGSYAPIGFVDLWTRLPSGRDSSAVGAAYQSVLTNLAWGALDGSPFLQALRQAAGDGLLSIKFNVDSYSPKSGDPGFTYGRLVGAIGPASAAEPWHFVAGRQLMPLNGTPNFNVCAAVVDQGRGKVLLDLGNALTTSVLNGPLADVGDLELFAYQPTPPNHQLPLGVLTAETYTAADWYAQTAGIVEFPPDRALTAAELERIGALPLALESRVQVGQGGALGEDPRGLYVRADQFVFRLSADDQPLAEVKLYATQFGQPYPHARIVAIFDPSGLQQAQPVALDTQQLPPDVGTPTDALSFPSLVVSGADGVALLPIRAHNPGNPRGYLDGQVYAVRPLLEDQLGITGPTISTIFNPFNFISLLVWDSFTPTDPVTWWGTSDQDSIAYILTQYANLYPVMLDFVNLGDYDAVCSHRDLLKLAFGLDVSNPNSMPVTRDLSPAKRAAILRWLEHHGPDGKPLLGVARQAPLAQPASTPAPTTSGEAPPQQEYMDGSKMQALHSRVGNQRYKRRS